MTKIDRHYITKEEELGITKELLQELFTYSDGILYCRKKTSAYSRTGIGNEVGTLSQDGYRRVVFNKMIFQVHRLIFIMHFGYCPRYIDHKDTIRDNNLIENLRPATSSQNSFNRSMANNNSEKTKGVCYYSWSEKPWRASIRISGNIF